MPKIMAIIEIGLANLIMYRTVMGYFNTSPSWQVSPESIKNFINL
jgi:hypothetical protein